MATADTMGIELGGVMLIATFGPSTGWAGKTIGYGDGRFTLEGVGPLSASDVLTYDRHGHISWAHAGLREWVQQLAAMSAAAAPRVQPLGATRPYTPTAPSVQAARSHKVRNIVLGIEAALVLLVVIVVVAGLGQSPNTAISNLTSAEKDYLEDFCTVTYGIRDTSVTFSTIVDKYPQWSEADRTELIAAADVRIAVYKDWQDRQAPSERFARLNALLVDSLREYSQSAEYLELAIGVDPPDSGLLEEGAAAMRRGTSLIDEAMKEMDRL
jgi:hypothetical protein